MWSLKENKFLLYNFITQLIDGEYNGSYLVLIRDLNLSIRLSFPI